MRVVNFTIGTRGDVQPNVALGLGLQAAWRSALRLGRPRDRPRGARSRARHLGRAARVALPADGGHGPPRPRRYHRCRAQRRRPHRRQSGGCDQPFWGARVAQLGAGPPPIPQRDLTVDRLAGAVRTATSDPTMRYRAAALGMRIRAENGVGVAAAAFGEHLCSREAGGLATPRVARSPKGDPWHDDGSLDPIQGAR